MVWSTSRTGRQGLDYHHVDNAAHGLELVEPGVQEQWCVHVLRGMCGMRIEKWAFFASD